MTTNDQLQEMGRNSLAQVESRLQQLRSLARAGDNGESWQPPRWAAHINTVAKARWMIVVYSDLQEILRKRLGMMGMFLIVGLLGCGRSTSVQASLSYTDGPCTATIQYWR